MTLSKTSTPPAFSDVPQAASTRAEATMGTSVRTVADVFTVRRAASLLKPT